MPRETSEIMYGWEFALEIEGEKNFKPVILPHDWAIEAPIRRDMKQGADQGYRDKFRVGWYRKSLNVERKIPHHKYYLDFGGIYEDSTIWVNGIEVGGRKYGYSSFRVDITAALSEGGNEILVRVDNTKAPGDRWYSGAGIYRTVQFIEVEEHHLNGEDIVVHTEVSEERAFIVVNCGINSPVKAELVEANQSSLSEDGYVSFKLDNPCLWSAEKPNLYTLRISLLDGECEADTISMRIGLRDIAMVPGKGMFVNGERVILKGVCMHQDVACRGIAVKKELWRERLLILKEMGCNAIRAAHHTFPTEFLDLCDELGFYLYEECFDKWTGGLYGRYYESEWERDIDSMVKRDRNRACIVIWGVGNEVENQGQESMLTILRKFTEYVKTLDATRPVTYAMNPHFKRESNIDVKTVKDIQQFVDEVDDREIYEVEEKIARIKVIADIVDIISCNYQEPWYEDIHAAIPDKLILGTEVYQYFMGPKGRLQGFSQENPSLVPFEKDYVIGSMIWTGFDYLGESMGYPSKGWSGSLIRSNGIKRPCFYILQSYWQEEPMVHFSVMDYSLGDEFVKEYWDTPPFADHWQFPQYRKAIIPYMIASNCDEVELYVNDKQYQVPKPRDCASRLIQGFIPYEPGTVQVVGYRNQQEVCRHQITTPGPASKLSFEKSELSVPAENGYEMLLTVSAEDCEGNHCFRESAVVRFRVEGAARILAVDNGCLLSNGAYQDDFIHMHDGYASVLVRLELGEASLQPSRIKVVADAQGMQSGEALIHIAE